MVDKPQIHIARGELGGGNATIDGTTPTSLTGLLKGDGAVVSVASAPTDYVATGDSRLSDARTPTAHTHPESDVVDLISDLGALAAAITGKANTVHTHVASDITGTAVLTADARLSDARVPIAHKTSHENGGSDEVSVSGLSGLLADAQTALAHTHAEADVTGLVADLSAKLDDSQASAFGLSLLDDVDAASGRTTLALGTLATQSGTFSGTSSGVNTGDQTLPAKATGAEVDTGTDDAKFVTAKAMEDSVYIKAAYADAKVADAINDATTTIAPSQNAVFDALALKAPLASPTFTGTVAGITKTMVGLGSVDNTTDAAKPVSTAQQTALDAKQATLISATNIKTINGSTVLGAGDLVVSGAAPAFSTFTKDLGIARRSGSFDLTGLSGLVADKPVMIAQSSAPIASKGNARDEPEMDQIQVTGHVVDATTIRCYWQAASVVVGIYAFSYLIGA